MMHSSSFSMKKSLNCCRSCHEQQQCISTVNVVWTLLVVLFAEKTLLPWDMLAGMSLAGLPG